MDNPKEDGRTYTNERKKYLLLNRYILDNTLVRCSLISRLVNFINKKGYTIFNDASFHSKLAYFLIIMYFIYKI